jgi:hypothetical protein
MADACMAGLFNDNSVGMVFPDDPHVLGSGPNRVFAEALAAKMGLMELPEHLIFPVGTMFWARTSSLAPLINLGRDWEDYPEEPLPYDGMPLHAIERLLMAAASVGRSRCAPTNVVGLTR